MDKLIYTAMTGAKHDLARQDVLTNNLANVNTTGFRGQSVAFSAQPVQDGGFTRVFSIETTPGADFSPGPMQATGNPLDVAVNGPGWIAVQPSAGGEAYTRNGSLEVGPEGLLRTKTGRLVLGDGGPISVPPDHAVSVERDGTVTAVQAGTAGKTVLALGRIKLVNPPEDQLARGDDGLFRLRSGAPANVDPGVVLERGTLEGSNVNPVEALVGMIALARQFDLHMKLLQNADAADRQAAQLLAVSG
jgi:flagellar basal-body rod protein FlgF